MLTWLAILPCCAGIVSLSAFAQRPKGPPARQTSPSTRTPIDYAKFSHETRQHQEACQTCHTVPSTNWLTARGFPDIADFPGHEACVRCHRSQFFRGAQPAICTNCHSRVSPRDDARFSFPNRERPRQFLTEFPHAKHQDVIASWSRPEQFKQVALVAFAHAAQEQKKDYNNCTICHAANMKEPVPPAGGWVDKFAPQPATFKTVPDSHSSCFNCHWRNQEPTAANCGGCHKLTAPYFFGGSRKRTSLKFTHAREQHVAECTTCHINITKSATLRGLKPDVPISGCTECHNKEGLRQDLNNELEAVDKNKDFVCVYCHTSEIGRNDPPAGHYLAAERQPLKRKDLK